jgi:hypothetical protein
MRGVTILHRATQEEKSSMFGLNLTTGSMVTVKFIRNGKEHTSIRWCSDPGLAPRTGGGFEKEIKAFYQRMGAEILSIRKIECMEVCCDGG